MDEVFDHLANHLLIVVEIFRNKYFLWWCVPDDEFTTSQCLGCCHGHLYLLNEGRGFVMGYFSWFPSLPPVGQLIWIW
jgi:hypothetical protein